MNQMVDHLELETLTAADLELDAVDPDEAIVALVDFDEVCSSSKLINPTEYTNFVRSIAWKVHNNTSGFGRFDYDDLVQYGWIGLLKAISNFDVKQSVRFATYAYQYVYGEMMHAVNSMNPSTRGDMERAKRIRRAREKFSTRLHRTPTDQELAHELGLSLKEYHKLEGKSGSVTIVPIETEYDQLTGKAPNEPLDLSPVQEALMLDTGIKNAIRAILKAFPADIRNIFFTHYIDGMSFSEIAANQHETEIDIARKVGMVLHELRAKMKQSEWEKEDYLLDAGDNIAATMHDMHTSDITLSQASGNEEVKRRWHAIAPVAYLEDCTMALVQQAAESVGVSKYSIYYWLRDFRAADCEIEALGSKHHRKGNRTPRLKQAAAA